MKLRKLFLVSALVASGASGFLLAAASPAESAAGLHNQYKASDGSVICMGGCDERLCCGGYPD